MHYLDVPSVIHSPADGRLNCFHLGAIILDFAWPLRERVRLLAELALFLPQVQRHSAIKAFKQHSQENGDFILVFFLSHPSLRGLCLLPLHAVTSLSYPCLTVSLSLSWS